MALLLQRPVLVRELQPADTLAQADIPVPVTVPELVDMLVLVLELVLVLVLLDTLELELLDKLELVLELLDRLVLVLELELADTRPWPGTPALVRAGTTTAADTMRRWTDLEPMGTQARKHLVQGQVQVQACMRVQQMGAAPSCTWV